MHLKFLKGYAHFDNSSWEELRSKGFSLMTFVLPCTIFLYDTRYLLHLLVLEPPYANRLLIDSGFYAAKPFRHCYLVHNWKKNKNWIFPPIFICFVNKTMHFPSSYWTPFSHLFREKIWNFCLNFPALLLTSISWVSTHCQVFSFKSYLTILSAAFKLQFWNFCWENFVKKRQFQKCGRNLFRDDEKTIYIPFMQQQQVSIKAINATKKIT